MSNTTKRLRWAALVTGLALLGSVVAAPFAEMYVMPKLVVPYQAAETARNILAHKTLFTAGVFAYFLTFLFDVVLAWSLYHLMKPVNKPLAQLTAGFRLVYAVVALVALNNLVTALRLVTTPEYATLLSPEQAQDLAMVYLRAFKNHWYFGLLHFGIHLVLLGYLVFKSTYIPRLLGVAVAITGIGYLLTSLRPYLAPDLNFDFAMVTFYGELLFMGWLLIRGQRIQAPLRVKHRADRALTAV
ncbi:DUF4386 domain-containing protein [Hymenobacter properus]|uniref:DUF4386 domain-containing protein n=1 Tax=Hymenobacter properus TaxID=2791026 RepID=A0A931BEE4_9BACT|nr:DUF4386 domain-containing protein [Hymenobacter properus]MBF9141889.1 DUF4386 domain-containing protein [Hymenobacter properus]MBR7720697.1 DUF4386 domain-containing protein [Microvirga sp. SRT04]